MHCSFQYRSRKCRKSKIIELAPNRLFHPTQLGPAPDRAGGIQRHIRIETEDGLDTILAPGQTRQIAEALQRVQANPPHPAALIQRHIGIEGQDALGAILAPDQRRQIEQALQRQDTNQRYPSAAIAITAGIVGIVALPIICAIVVPICAYLAAFFARFSSSQERREDANKFLLTLFQNLPFIFAGLIPGASILATNIYLGQTTPNDDGSRTFSGFAWA